MISAKNLLMALATALVILPPVQLLAQGETADDPIVVTTCAELNGMRNNLDAHYALGNDIDCSATSTWNANAGWEPIGTATAPFNGSLNGNGHTVSGLTINREANDNIGLFGVSGTESAITNLGLVAVRIAGDDIVGAVAGKNYGTITNTYATGTFTFTYSEAGGLVGYNHGTIHNCYSTIPVNVASGGEGGGLVGFNFGTITHSHATGPVTGYELLGGLVGRNEGTGSIADSYATGNVGSRNDYIGGFVGENDGTIAECYATGSVSGDDTIGGFVGNHDTGTIRDSYATGAVNAGSGYVGGFAGRSDDDTRIDNSYSVGPVTAPPGDSVGGFAGYISGPIIAHSFYDSETSGQSDDTGKGEPKSTAAMKDSTTFTAAGWDFATIWGNDPTVNNGYPTLLWRYTVGGTVSGLAAGNSVVLQINGADNLTVAADGAFTFTAPLDDGSPYEVTVLTQPAATPQLCTVTNGSGTVAGANVTTVEVTCADLVNLTMAVLPEGAGTTTPPVGSTGVVVSAPQPIVATANAGYDFVNWTSSGGAAVLADPGSASTTVTMTADATVTANFCLLHTWYPDADDDGFGDPAGTTVEQCSQPDGYVEDNTDCNDADALQHPDQTWYKDEDGDGYSDGTSCVACLRPAGYFVASELTATSGDPDDTNPKITPDDFPWPLFMPAIQHGRTLTK